jgi:hypothetical protein
MEFPVVAVLTIKIGIGGHRGGTLLTLNIEKSSFHHFYLFPISSPAPRSNRNRDFAVVTEVAVCVAELLTCEPYS